LNTEKSKKESKYQKLKKTQYYLLDQIKDKKSRERDLYLTDSKICKNIIQKDKISYKNTLREKFLKKKNDAKRYRADLNKQIIERMNNYYPL